MTWLQPLADIAIFVLVTLISFAMKMYVIPYLVEHRLVEVAKVLVNAAQAIYGAGHGKDKLDYCVKQIEEKYHINLDYDVVYNAIQSAWLELDEKQNEHEGTIV